MTNLFDAATAGDVKERIGQLAPESVREWGTMTAPQALAHCSKGIEMALGEQKTPRMMVGRILGPVIKRMAFRDDAPMRKNVSTSPSLVVKDERNLQTEKVRLAEMVDRFTTTGANGCTEYPHFFFGALSAEEWAVLTYKHLDHHLRQFGV